VTSVRFFNEPGRSRLEEYRWLKENRPQEMASLRDAITLLVKDPDRAEHDFSVWLGDPKARWLVMPFRAPDGIKCLVWRHAPDGGDEIEIAHFQQAWGDELPRPRFWLEERPDYPAAGRYRV